jgi:hypothetical protein
VVVASGKGGVIMSKKEKLQALLFLSVFIVAVLLAGHIDYEFINAGLIP